MEPENLEGYAKKQRLNKEERYIKAIEGRDDFKHRTHAGGLTNKEKMRTKNFLMVRKGKRSVRGRLQESSKETAHRVRKGNAKMQLKRERRKRRRT